MRTLVFGKHCPVAMPFSLTFDDGPDPVWTPAVLDALARAGARATFFVLGEAAERHPGLVHRVLAEGHAVEVHGHAHLRHPEHRGGPDRVRPIVEGERERHRHRFRTVLPKDQRPHPACATVGSMWHRPVILSLSCSLALAACGGDGAPVPPATAASRATVVWAVGDGGTGTKAAKQVAALIARDRPDHVIYLGDVYDHGTREEFQTKFAPVYGALARRMWPTPGNHDWPSHATGYGPYWRAALGRRLPYRYERRAGGWRVLSANSATPDDPRQLAWLRERTSGGGDCRIVF